HGVHVLQIVFLRAHSIPQIVASRGVAAMGWIKITGRLPYLPPPGLSVTAPEFPCTGRVARPSGTSALRAWLSLQTLRDRPRRIPCLVLSAFSSDVPAAA